MEEANAETSGARGDQNAVKAEEKRRGGDMGTWGRERKEVERREREAKERRKRYREDSPGSGSKKGSKRNSRRDGSDEAKPETSGPQGGKSVVKAQEKKEDRAKHLQTEEERHQQEGKGSEARRGKDARERREQEVKEKVKRDRERERKVMEGSSGSRSEGSTGNSKRDGPGGPLASDEAKKESPANDRDSHTVPTADQEDSIPHKASPPPDAVSMDTTVMESPDDDKDSHTVPTAEEEDSILKDYGKSDFTEIFYSYGVVIGYHCKLCDHRAVARRAAEIRDHLNGRKHNVMLIQTKSLRSLYLAKKRDDIEDICRDEGIVAVNKHPSTRFHCKLCERDYRPTDVYHHLMGKWHIGSLWAKKQKDKLRDEALKKTSRKDEAAGKVLCKDQENIKVGEDVKTDKTKVGLAQQSEESKTINTLPEELNKIKETKSSSSAAGDGEASSSKPADLELPKESPADDKDSHTVPTADQEDSIPQEHGNSVYLEEVCFDDGTVFGFHCKVCECSFLTDTKDAHLKGSVHQENEIEAIANLNKYVVEVNNPNESRCFYCRLCDCSVANLSTMDFHMKGRKHAAKLRAKDGMHARKLKAKDQLDKDRLDFKVELEEDQFQDLPHFLDFETVDEVGNVNDFPSFPPPDAVTMDTTVMVDKESPANMRDSHTVPTADKEDSITQENEKSVPREKKKGVKMDNRNAEGDSKFSGEDEYVEEIPNRNSKVILLHCKLCKCIFQKNNTFAKEQHLKGQRHAISLQLLVEKSKTEECFEEVRTPNGKVIFLRCKLCEGSIGLNAKDQHLKTETHTRRFEIKRYFDAKKLKEDKLRDDTDEKTSSKDEAAGKELSKDQQDIKVGEELSNAAPTQVCKADVKTDKIKVALAKQPDEGKPINTPPEELDKINPGPMETTSSSSAAGDGEVSSRKPADLDLPKESPGDDKDSHTVPTADKEDSTPQENKKSAPRERKKDFNVDNRNLEGDEKISGKDEYIEEVCDAGGKVILFFRCKLCECRLNNLNNKQQHLKGKLHNLLLLGKKRKAIPTADKVDLIPQLNEKSLPGRKTQGGVDNKNAEVSEKISGKDEYVEVRNPSGKVILLLCKVCERSIKLNDKDQHPKTEAHTQRLKRKCFSDAKKLKEGKPRDDADEKTSCKDEAAGKELSKDRQDIKVGQVCNPEADVKTDKIKASLTKQPEESKTINTSPEGLNKINSGPKETKSSSSAAGDGGDSANKPADLELSKDSHTAPTADQEDSTPRGNDKSVPGEKTKKKVGNKMDNKSAQGDEKTGGKDAYVEEVRSSIGKVIRLHCNLCECSVMLNAKDQHLKTDTHQRRLKLRRYFDAKKLKEGELRHETDEKISSRDEAAGKEPSKDQQDIKVGEELSNAAPTQVCNPEAEGLDKINSGPKETKSSSSAAGDGEVSSNKPDDLELPKVEPEEDQFQDFPFDMADFVTVDEVGDGDESDLPGSPPGPAAVSTVTSEAVEEKSTETPRESEAEATPVPEDTPQASPGPVTLATAAPEKSEPHSQTLDPVVTAEQHPHSPVPPQAMCSSDQLDAPVPLPVADDSLPTSSSPKGATTPDLEACSSGVTPTAGGEQENQGPVGHSQAEEEVTEKVEQMEDEEDKEKPAASVSAKRLMSEDKRRDREEEPMQKKLKIQAATADNPLPFDPNSADAPAGMEFLVPRTGFFCQVCNSFFSGEQESELNHCKSLEHNDNLQKYLKSRKTTSI